MGVGTSTPYSKLTVWGQDSATGTVSFLVASAASTTAFTVDNAGNGYLKSRFGIGSTTPGALLAITSAGTSVPSILVGSGAGTQFVVAGDGNVGIGTSTPSRKFSVTDTVAAPQIMVSYDQTRYGTLQVDSSGNLLLASSNGSIRMNNENAFICSGGGCPTLGAWATASSTAGSLHVENAVIIGDGFSLRQVDSVSLGLYNVDGTLMVTFDNGN